MSKQCQTPRLLLSTTPLGLPRLSSASLSRWNCLGASKTSCRRTSAPSWVTDCGHVAGSGRSKPRRRPTHRVCSPHVPMRRRLGNGKQGLSWLICLFMCVFRTEKYDFLLLLEWPNIYQNEQGSYVRRLTLHFLGSGRRFRFCFFSKSGRSTSNCSLHCPNED